MPHILDYPSLSDSLLRNVDPRWKLAGITLAVIAVALLRTLPTTTIAVLAAFVLFSLSGQSFRWYLVRLLPMVLFLALFAGPLPFLLHDAGPAWMIGPLRVSER